TTENGSQIRPPSGTDPGKIHESCGAHGVRGRTDRCAYAAGVAGSLDQYKDRPYSAGGPSIWGLQKSIFQTRSFRGLARGTMYTVAPNAVGKNRHRRRDLPFHGKVVPRIAAIARAADNSWPVASRISNRGTRWQESSTSLCLQLKDRTQST